MNAEITNVGAGAGGQRVSQARRGLPSMPVAGRLISTIGWAWNSMAALGAAVMGPILLMVGAMDDSGRMWDRLFSGAMFMRVVAPLLVGACFVLAGNRLAGRGWRRSSFEALGALLGPPVVAFIAVLVVLKIA